MQPGSKNIIICSDGTGNSTIKGRGTNVFKLFEAIDVNGHRTDARLCRQLAFYDDGVGTESLKWLRIFAGATGYGLSRNVKQLYRELCRVYEPGDGIYLFGFSRGAFTVRTLAGLINDCGILDARRYPTEDGYRKQVRDAYTAYRTKYRALLTRALRTGPTADTFKREFARSDAPPEPIRFLGVWDTVDAVGLPFKLSYFWNRVVWQYKFETPTLGDAVARACHALALDDERAAFAPVLWDERDPSTCRRVEQVWFPGAHSNVGGGYPQQGMSLVALDWMMKQAEQAGLRFVAHTREEYATVHSFADKLYDPRAGLGMFYRWKPRDVCELARRCGIEAPVIHTSAIERLIQAPEGYAPGNLPPRLRIVATEDLPQVRLAEVAATVADAHGGIDAKSLGQRKRAWIHVGLVGYLVLIAGMGGAALRMATLVMRLDPRAALSALWSDPLALPLLAAGLTAGYLLVAWSAHRTRRYYSGFWHKHRARLREALRRTPVAVAGAQVQDPAYQAMTTTDAVGVA
jgi:uncharacterized protein (DUF2235 family)